MPLHPLTNFEVLIYQYGAKSNGFYSINKLFKIKDGAYMINFDYYESIGTHLTALYVNAENVRILLHWIYWFDASR